MENPYFVLSELFMKRQCVFMPRKHDVIDENPIKLKVTHVSYFAIMAYPAAAI